MSELERMVLNQKYNKIKIRKALTSDLSFLVVILTSPVAHRAERLIAFLITVALKGAWNNPRVPQEKLRVEGGQSGSFHVSLTGRKASPEYPPPQARATRHES